MAIRAKQIGWSQESNLLWQISYQLDRLIQVAGGPYTTTSTSTSTTTTTTTAPPSFSVRYYMGSYDATTPCAGLPVSGNPNYSSTSNPLLLSQLFSDAALTTATIMSNGGGYYTFSYDSGVTLFSAEFTGFGTVISSVTPC
jgi:hypothetical protein